MRLFQAPPFYYHETTAATFLTGPLEEGGGGNPPILANQLTLFQPEWADYAHYTTTRPPGCLDLPRALF